MSHYDNGYQPSCYTLKKTDTVRNIKNFGKDVFFRIMYFPDELDPNTIDDENFLELMFQQIHRLIHLRTWICQDDVIFKLAGIDCYMNLGMYNQNMNINNILKEVIPEDIFKYQQINQIRYYVSYAWSQIKSDLSMQQLQKLYISTVRNMVPQYGLCTFIQQLLQVDQIAIQNTTYVYLCVSKTKMLVLDTYGQIMLQGYIKDLQIQQNNNILNISAQGRFLSIQLLNIQDYNETIYFLQKAKYE